MATSARQFTSIKCFKPTYLKGGIILDSGALSLNNYEENSIAAVIPTQTGVPVVLNGNVASLPTICSNISLNTTGVLTLYPPTAAGFTASQVHGIPTGACCTFYV